MIESVKVKSGRETTRNQIMTKIAGKEELVNIVSESGDKLYFPKVQIIQEVNNTNETLVAI